ncbi:MAG: nucleotidyltransferase substrate binding protein [Candidatus Hydrogenedentes bacterium]|nr:nucleotidyltransferase substrate binding protein [Candidatus Hydrogenedentota bacterium]
MNDPAARQTLENLGHALQRLKEALEVPADNTLAIDGTIQRFEFVIELFWKAFKRLLAAEGTITRTPRESLRAAFEAHWIQNESVWLEMLDDRNLISHLYHEALARKVHARIKKNFPQLQKTYRHLTERFGTSEGEE